MRRLSLVLLATTSIVATPAAATVYDVGPGQPLASIGAVPWATLMPGDVVQIHHRPTPYAEKWVIGRSGTEAAPIVVRGVLGPNDERPVITGASATTPDPLDFTGGVRAVIKIGTSNVPAETLPEHIVVENLEVRSAHPSYSFSDDDSATRSYATNAAALWVERGRHIVIRNCELHDSGNGLFVSAYEGDTRDILIEGNYIHGNGNVGSAFEHNTYTAAIGIVYQFNRFGPPRAGAVGNNLKDRSAGLVVRNNWIEGGNRQLDLVEGDDTDAIPADPGYRETFVYGNVLIEPNGAGNSQIVHYGGDNGDASLYRKGTLHFYQNTVVSYRSGNTTLLRLSTDDETADVRNNVLYVAASGDRLGIVDETGTALLSHNWIKPDWTPSHSGLPADVVDDNTGYETADPGFSDVPNSDFHPMADAVIVNAGGALHPDALPVTRQYALHQDSEVRPGDGAPDLGAFEYCAVPCPEPAGMAAFAVAIATLGGVAVRKRR
jgi:hypothetical protein